MDAAFPPICQKHTEAVGDEQKYILLGKHYSFSVVLLKSISLIRGKLVFRINDKLCCSFHNAAHHTPALMDYG